MRYDYGMPTYTFYYTRPAEARETVDADSYQAAIDKTQGIAGVDVCGHCSQTISLVGEWEHTDGVYSIDGEMVYEDAHGR